MPLRLYDRVATLMGIYTLNRQISFASLFYKRRLTIRDVCASKLLQSSSVAATMIVCTCVWMNDRLCLCVSPNVHTRQFPPFSLPRVHTTHAHTNMQHTNTNTNTPHPHTHKCMHRSFSRTLFVSLACPFTHTYARAHTHMRAQSRPSSFFLFSLSLYLSLSHTLSRSRTRFLSLPPQRPLSLCHTSAHSLSLFSLCHTSAHSLSLFITVPYTNHEPPPDLSTLSFTLPLSLSLPPSLSLSLAFHNTSPYTNDKHPPDLSTLLLFLHVCRSLTLFITHCV